MMRQRVRAALWLVLSGLLMSLLAIASTETATAAESIPTLQWPAVDVGRRDSDLIVSPTGSVTVPCTTLDSGRDLVTYSATGQQVRQLDRNTFVDGVQNCLNTPVVDKNDVIYGLPYGKNSSGSYVRGPNLLAYSGNTLKWKYPLTCSSSQPSNVAVGADGRIYATAWLNDGVHLIGLTPEVQPPLTGPAKVFDVKIPDDCSAKLYPYKDGVMVHGQQYGNARYYSYGGTYLGQATIGDVWYEKMNAEGRLFVASRATDVFRSGVVSMYDPRVGSVAWTATASTPGAKVSSIKVVPLASGGALAYINEEKMSGSVPAIPSEYVYTLVTLGAAGQKLRSATLSNTATDGSGYKFSNLNVYAETTGQVVTTRYVSVPTQVSSPSTVDAFSLGVYDPLSGVWGYQAIMKGNTQPPASPTSYSLDGSTLLSPGTNTIYLVAHCTYCSPKLYPIQVPGIGMDYPRGAALNRTPRPSSAYVALGDSFSSGEGVEPFDSNTAMPGINNCHRSQYAYARTIAGSSAKIPSLGSDGFRACSGAITDNVLDLAQWNENAQVDLWRDTGTQLVTITIGGNDMGFANFGAACFWGNCDTGTTAYNTAVSNINNLLPARLDWVYTRLLDMYPNAKIYVLGYPQVVAYKSTTSPDDARCWYMQGGNTKYGNARAARAIVDLLNGKIQQRVDGVRALSTDNYARLHFIDVAGPTSPFNGHEVCGTATTSWFQNVDQTINDPAYAFHPNLFGQDGYATIAAAEINAG